MRKTIVFICVAILGVAGGAGGMYAYLTGWSPSMAASETAADARDEHGHAGEEAELAHAGHDEHEEGVVQLPEETVRQFGIELATAEAGEIGRVLRTPCEIVLNADRVAHIVPRVAGMVREVHKSVGDKVQAGDVLAVMESRELAEAKAVDLAAEARLKLTEANFKRIEDLVKENISSKQQYQEALQALEEARIAHRGTVAKLHALGVSHEEFIAVAEQGEAEFARYEIKAPFAGTIVDKHAVLGEVHDTGSDMFVLADLSTVWAEMAVYSQDMPQIRVGGKVRLPLPNAGESGGAVEGSVFYVSPMIREDTRAGTARAAIDNSSGEWRPGSFVTAEVEIGRQAVPVLVPATAIQVMENQPVVFVADEDGDYVKREVTLGASNETHAAVMAGLTVGERYVAKGAFVLKAELSKGTGEHEH